MNKARLSGPRIFLHLLCVTFLCLWALPASPADETSEDDEKNPFGAAQIGSAEIRLDLAWSKKIAADEAFIRGGSCTEGSLPKRASVIRS